MVSRPPLPSFFIIRDRRRRHQAAQAAPSGSSDADTTTVHQRPSSSKQPPQQQAQPQRPASTEKKMGASMSSQATTVSLRTAGGSKSKSRKGGGSSTSASASAPSAIVAVHNSSSSDPDLAGVSPTDGKIQPAKDSPSDGAGDDDGAGRPFPTTATTTSGGAASPLSKRQKASAASLLLAAAGTPGLANEDNEVDGFDQDSETDGFGTEDSKLAAAGGSHTGSTTTTTASGGVVPAGGGGGGGGGGGEGSVLAAASECCARLLFSGAPNSPSLGSSGNLGIGSLKVASAAAEADDDGRDDIADDIIVDDGDDGDIATDGEEEGRDDIEEANNISGSSSAGSDILQTLLGGSGAAPKASPSGNTATPTTTTTATAITAGNTSTANVGGKKSLGHIGDGRRLAKKTTGGTSPTDEEIGKAGDKARSKATNTVSEMPIQMMTSRRAVTSPSSSSVSAPTASTSTNANAKPPKRLSREVRGLLASAGGDGTGIGSDENVHPNTASNNGGGSNPKKKGSGNGGNGKPLTRSKAKQQQKMKAKKTTVPPHLLQEHPSVRNSNKAVGPTTTTIKSSSSKSGKSGGLGLASALNLRNRAAQQAASPATAIIPSATTHVATPDHPRTLTLHGCRVTMIDDATKVFVIDAVTPDQCDAIRTMTDDYVRETALADPDKQTWRTLYTYTKMDLPCGEVPGLMDGIVDGIMSTVVDIVGSVYGNSRAASKLRPRSWKEPHLLHYQVLPDKPEHLGIEMHYDGCDVTWSLMLSDSADYDGGGTYIRCLRRTIMLRQGQILIHPGELYHCGNAVKTGTRSLMVCFMDGFDPQIIDASRASDDKEEFTKNVFLA